MPLLDVEQMDETALRVELKGWVAQRITFLAADARSYVVVKRLPVMSVQHHLGGGNFLIAGSGVACLEFLSVVHVHLGDGSGLWSSDDVVAWDNAKAHLVESGALSRPERDMLLRPKPRAGQVKTAATVVRHLLIAFEDLSGNESGLPTHDAPRFAAIWSAFRDHLAHKMSPAIGCTILGMSPEQVAESGLTDADISEPFGFTASAPFAPVHGHPHLHWSLNGELLALGFLPAVAESLVSKIEQCEDADRLRAALLYARGTAVEDV